jgi:hypothetical protein
VDEYLGISYFREFYARAASVFGALPSMHCAYPLIGLLTAWRAATVRTLPLHIVYTFGMFFASVYFDHHWIIDGLLGWVVAFVAVTAAGKLLDRWPALSASTPPAREEVLPEGAVAVLRASQAHESNAHRSGLPVSAPPKVL